MSRIIWFIRKELAVNGRDSIILYMIFASLLMAIALNYFLPSAEAAENHIAVDESLPESFIERLHTGFIVEKFDDEQAVKERVLRFDSVFGIVSNGQGSYKLIAQGNEGEEHTQEMAKVVQWFEEGEDMSNNIIFHSLGVRSTLKENAGSFMALMATLIGGIYMGFSLVAEKESGMVRALAVSPLSMFDFVISRLIVGLVICLVMSIGTTFILFGAAANYWLVFLGTLAAFGFSAVLAFIVGGLADNQIGAITVMKLVGAVMGYIPIGALFVSASWQWVFYIFPSYWVFQIYQNIFSSSPQFAGFTTVAIIALVYNWAAVAVLMVVMRRRLRFK